MRQVVARRAALAACGLIVACLPVFGGAKPGDGGGGSAGKPAVGPRYEGVVKAISAESITISAAGGKSAKPGDGGSGGGERDITLGLSGDTKYADLSYGSSADLAVGQPVAMLLVKENDTITARALATFKGTGKDGEALCQAATGPLMAAVKAAGGAKPGDGGSGGDKPMVPKALVGTVDSIDGGRMIVNVGGNKLAVDISHAGTGKIEPRDRANIAVGRKVVALCGYSSGDKPGDGGGKTVSALLQLPDSSAK